MTTSYPRALTFVFLVPAFFFGFALSAQAAAPVLTVSNITMVPKAPTCEARATKRVIRSGDSLEIVWKSRGAEKMIGLTDEGEWEANGRQRVAIAVRGKHVFPLTFVSEKGIASSCPVTVFVHAKRTK